MKALESVLGRAEELHRDLSFQAVRAWKAQDPGRRVIGYLPIYVPREIIHAAGMLPVGIVGHGDLEIIRGDAYFQSYICHLPRSVIELGVSKRLEMLDGLIFPAICDVIRNLSGMWQLLFPETWVKYLDVPQNFDPEVGGRFYRGELERIRDDLAELAGRRIEDDHLRESLARYNENRRLVEELYARRSRTPWFHPTPEVYLIVRAGNVLPVEDHSTMIREYLAATAEREARARDHVRVVVSGAFCEQPPLELLRTIERAGCYIVDDDLLLGHRWIRGDIPPDPDPIGALTGAYLDRSVRSASRYEPEGKNGEALVEAVRDHRADGVVFCAPSFCDPSLLDQPMAGAALEAAGIPYTTFKYAENTGQFQVIREQAGTFSDSIRLWGDA